MFKSDINTLEVYAKHFCLGIFSFEPNSRHDKLIYLY